MRYGVSKEQIEGEVFWQPASTWLDQDEGWYFVLKFSSSDDGKGVVVEGPFRTKRQAKRALRRAVRSQRWLR